MALTATALQGFVDVRYVSAGDVFWVPADPGDTLTAGDQVVGTVGEGIVDLAAANEGGMVGVVDKTTVVSAATVAFPTPAEFHPADITNASYNTLVPVKIGFSGMLKKATFASHYDDTVVSYTANTRAIACTTGMGADDRPAGGLLYVYEGPGAGEINIVESYDHTGGAAELLLICHRPFKTTLTSASKFIVLGGEAAGSRGMGFFNRMEGDNNNLLCNQGADDGDYVIVGDWRDMANLLSNLTITVIQKRYEPLA